jgi:hypothetical protein
MEAFAGAGDGGSGKQPLLTHIGQEARETRLAHGPKGGSRLGGILNFFFRPSVRTQQKEPAVERLVV